jgi:uncharacterized protein
VNRPQNARVREIGPLLRERHGRAVRRVGLRVGASCPNRDGTLGRGGCLFCGEAEPGEPPPMQEQLARALARLAPDHAAIGYLQDHTATHAPVARLEAALQALVDCPRVVGIVVGTRPDALPRPVLEALHAAARRKDLLVELGLQSADDEVLRFARRMHGVACFGEAVRELHRRGLRVGAHVILGLPRPGAGGLAPEGKDGARATARLLAGLGVEAVKIHNCHALRGTALAELRGQGRFEPPDLPAYLELLVTFLEHLPPEVEVHRLCGEARPPALLAPAFTAEKSRTLQLIRATLEKRDTWQGRLAGSNAFIDTPGNLSL